MTTLELILVTVVSATISTVYHKLMFKVYCSEAWANFDHLVKVLTNHFAFARVERSLLRNVIFNISRCMFDEMLAYVIHGDELPQEVLVLRILLIITFTVFVEFGINKKAAERYATEYCAFQIVYVTSFGLCFTSLISRVEQEFNGSLWRLFVMAYGLILAYLHGDMVEDLFFGDLGSWGGVWHNWSFYMPALTVMTTAFTMNHWLGLTGSLIGAWRHPHVSLLGYLYKTGRNPLVWPSLHF